MQTKGTGHHQVIRKDTRQTGHRNCERDQKSSLFFFQFQICLCFSLLCVWQANPIQHEEILYYSIKKSNVGCRSMSGKCHLIQPSVIQLFPMNHLASSSWGAGLLCTCLPLMGSVAMVHSVQSRLFLNLWPSSYLCLWSAGIANEHHHIQPVNNENCTHQIIGGI